MNLELHISDLLKRHNCVIVPEFGGFIANYESAWINRSRNIILPPHKQILFNSNLTQNDGLLANELVLKQALSYTDALEKIALKVKDWRKKLEEGSRIELNEIGFLYLQNNQVVFEQNRELNLLLQAFGLKQVSFVDFSIKTQPILQELKSEKAIEQKAEEKPHIKVAEKERIRANKDSVKLQKGSGEVTSTKVSLQETPVIALNAEEEITPVKEDPKVISISPKQKKSRNYKYAVAAAVILPVMFYAYWIPMKTDFLNTGKIQMSDLNPFKKSAAAVYVNRESDFSLDLSTDWKSWEELTGDLPENVSVYNFELNDELYIPVKLNNGALENTGFDQSASYHVIAGCFSIESNATKFVSDLNEKGYSAGIVDKNKGLYRVSAGAYASESEADQALSTFKNSGHSGWILKH